MHKSETLRTEVFGNQPKNDSVFAKRVDDILSQYSPEKTGAVAESPAERLAKILEPLTEAEREAVLASRIPALLEANARIATGEGTTGEIARAHAETVVTSGFAAYRESASQAEASHVAGLASLFEDAESEAVAA